MPRRTKGGLKPTTQAAMPTRFRCKVGGEWRPLSDFSQNQQRLVLGRSVNAAHSGMTCTEHNAKSRTELRCELCNIIKPTSHFSKNALRNEEFICTRCMAWSETQEPAVVPSALETGHVSWEEEEDGWGKMTSSTTSFFDDDDLPQAPVTGLESLGLEDSGRMAQAFSQVMREGNRGRFATSLAFSDTSSVVDEDASATGSRMPHRLPPHLAGRIKMSSISKQSESIKPEKEDDKPLPPHLRSRFKAGSSVNSETSRQNGPASNPGAPPRVGPGSTGNSWTTATTVREEHEEAKKAREVKFNAWDNHGKQHGATKSLTVASGSESTTSMTGGTKIDESCLVGWDSFEPSNESLKEPETRGGKGKWPKACEVRIPQAELKRQALPTRVAKHVDKDIDQQRCFNYCESDDSDF
ncbi:hypothetical protein FZEAL_6529 [Fusarium zealandicum]|uniref:Stc1 domain-containing protein n=1 Tax=Fusarium zealandicum TaxID=1053134 RepID=A0A8H4XIS8_9HYPO|nr:hypothetical protein FZEAL_6529 [Fusarium zealandicum]